MEDQQLRKLTNIISKQLSVKKLSLANDHVSYMVISVQSQNIINGKDSEETSHVVSLPSACH